jgi:glycosyltransferase involved in cell wall biosynthesis
VTGWPFLFLERIPMRLSLFTPTHTGAHLLEAYNSLRFQTVKDWEWVILPNKQAVIPERIAADKRVKIVKGGEKLDNIGALKRMACDAATGDAFLEFDHDDMLVPGDSLRLIRDKFLQGAGFVFSDTAVFSFKSQPLKNKSDVKVYGEFGYSSHHGWRHYPLTVYGRKLKATSCFEPSPRALSEIYYSPDHIRCWSRKAYYEAGGHNPELPVCDDQELMIKTYLSGAEFVHTGKCNYLYRLFEHNTVNSRNKLIQENNKRLRETHLQGLIQSWLKRKGYAELNITTLRRSGWNPERHLLQGFGENQYGHIVADKELQKLPGWQVREFMNEAYRALVPGGYLTITVPDAQSAIGYADVEWQSYFSSASMQPYTIKEAAASNGNIACRFQQIQSLEVYPSEWHRNNKHRFLRFDLVALKGQRQPGLQQI